jgi:hypothetical protein
VIIYHINEGNINDHYGLYSSRLNKTKYSSSQITGEKNDPEKSFHIHSVHNIFKIEKTIHFKINSVQ